MKFSKLCLLPLLGLSLVACGPTTAPTTSEQPSQPETSETTTTPEAQVPTAWTEEEIADQKKVLNDNVLPFFYVEGGQWVNDKTIGFVYAKLEGATIDDANVIVSALVKDKFLDLSKEPSLGLQPGQYMLVKQLPLFEERSEMLMASIIVSEGMLICQPVYFIDPWVEEDINAQVSEILGVPATLPKPQSFEVYRIELVQLPVYDPNVEQDIFALFVDDVRESTIAYAAELQELGYKLCKQETLGVYFVDPTGTYGYAFIQLQDGKGNDIALGILPVLVKDYPASGEIDPNKPTDDYSQADKDLMKSVLGEELPWFGFQGELVNNEGTLTFTAKGGASELNLACVVLEASQYVESTTEADAVRVFSKGQITVTVTISGENVVITAKKVA